MNYWIYSDCEPKEYIDWMKEIKVPLTSERSEELKKMVPELSEKLKRLEYEIQNLKIMKL